MSVSRVLFVKEKFGPFVLGTTPVPIPGPGDILVKVVSVGLNPVDWKLQARGSIGNYPAVLGRDAAGEVVAVGEGVTQFKKGDKVYVRSILMSSHLMVI